MHALNPSCDRLIGSEQKGQELLALIVFQAVLNALIDDQPYEDRNIGPQRVPRE
mgnify:CR=1 FL=1